MLYHKKNKIKLSLIDDFIQISLISNFCFSLKKINLFKENNTLREIFLLTSKLKSLYLSLIKRLKLDDISFNVLLADLNENNKLFEKEQKTNFKNIDFALNEMKKVLTRISYELNSKLKLLKIN